MADASHSPQSFSLEATEAAEAAAPEWARALAARLRRGPDPQRAAILAAQVIEAAAGDALDRAARQPETLARVLAALCSTAPFFVGFLRRHTHWLPALVGENYEKARTREELGRRLAATRSQEDPAAWLRSFKYYELARITVRDATPEWLGLERSGETLSELSTLADVLLDEALEIATAELADHRGAPLWTDGEGVTHELGFAVLALGKLGAGELNYSSDVDLVYVHETTPDGVDLDGPSGLNPLQYFTRLAQHFGRLVSGTTVDGFLYRIDIDLRPEGAQGLLVISELALEQYYESWAATWERAAFMKARPVAGDLRLGWRTIRAMAPMLYRSSMDFGSVEGIRGLKEKVEESRSRTDDGFDVKVGVGGIRDIEFVAQALQLLHGGRIPQLRERSTPRSLEQLGELGQLTDSEASGLLEAYRFLRRLENRLQMEAERQTHLLAEGDARHLHVARLMGYGGTDAEALAAFDRNLAQHRASARVGFHSMQPGRGRERVLELFLRNAAPLFALESTREMIEKLAERFAQAIDARANPVRALNNLARFVQGVGTRRFYYDLLLDRPELVGRLAALFDSSNHLSAILASHPRLIEPVFSDPEVLLLDRAALERDLRELQTPPTAAADGSGRDPLEHALDALRLFHHRQVLNIGLLDLAERVEASEVEAALSDVAEVCLSGALEIATQQLERRREKLASGDRIHFLVVGMGKLGTRELGYGSDLDLIFLFEVESGSDADRLEASDYCVRLAQRLIGALQTSTTAGSCYEIDARLRPSGNQGSLVTSLPAFARYHAGEDGRGAQAWERQALLRARPAGGDSALGRQFEALRREILLADAPRDLREQIDQVRMRMERELAKETRSLRDFKTGRGGVLDVESIVQLHQLLAAAEQPELLEACPLARQLDRLAERGRLEPPHADILRAGWRFLGRLSRRLRIVENRSISELDQERGDLEDLALRLGYEGGAREGEACRSLLRDYTMHTEAIRSVYLETFPSEETSR